MKNVLYIAYSYPPLLEANAILNGKITRSLADNGYRCHVLTIDPITGTSSVDSSLSVFSHVKNTVHTYRSYKNWRHAGLFLVYHLMRKAVPFIERLPDMYIWDMRRALDVANKIVQRENIDLIISTGSPFSGNLLGAKLKEKYSIPWLVHYFEPWAEQVYIRKNWINYTTNKILEKSVIQRADIVTFISKDIMNLAMDAYPQWRHKAHVFPLGFYAPSFPGGNEVVAKKTNLFTFRYIGSFYGIRTPEPLLKVVAQLKREYPHIAESCHFHCVGSVQADVKGMMEKYGIGAEVTFDPSVNYIESLRLMATADVLMTIDAQGEGEVCLPSKLVDYIGASRPLWGMSPAGGPAARLVHDAGGWVVDPDDIDGGVLGIKTMWERFSQNKYVADDGFVSLYNRYSLDNSFRVMSKILQLLPGFK